MARGPLFQDGYTPHFSGHQTFTLRYGWLKKVFDRVAETEDEPDNRNVCWDDGAIARFGVGKNMVASMRHWAKASGIIEEPTRNKHRSLERTWAACFSGRTDLTCIWSTPPRFG